MRSIVYIVEDDDAVRDSLSLVLRMREFEVEVFSSGPDFLARADLARCLCVVLDVNLPTMTGLEVLARLRSDGAEVPAIVMSGRAEPGMRREADRLGALAFLDKPVSVDRLVGLLGSRRAGASALRSFP